MVTLAFVFISSSNSVFQLLQNYGVWTWWQLGCLIESEESVSSQHFSCIAHFVSECFASHMLITLTGISQLTYTSKTFIYNYSRAVSLKMSPLHSHCIFYVTGFALVQAAAVLIQTVSTSSRFESSNLIINHWIVLNHFLLYADMDLHHNSIILNRT